MSLKRLVITSFLASLVGCDAIVNKNKLVPPEEPQIPQAVVEAVRYTNPGMLDATLTRIPQNKLGMRPLFLLPYDNSLRKINLQVPM